MNNPLPILERYGYGNDPAIRSAIIAGFFFRQEVPDIGEVMQAVMDEWLSWLPADIDLYYRTRNTEGKKPIKKGTLTRLRNEMLKEKYRGELWTTELYSDGSLAPEYGLDMCSDNLADWAEYGHEAVNNYISFYFSAQLIDDKVTRERWVDWVISIAERLDYVSAYSSYTLTGAASAMEYGWTPYLRKYAYRYPGFDIGVNHFTKHNIGTCGSKGARWLTLINAEAIGKLGGKDTLLSQLDSNIGVRSVGSGLMLRASDLPELGEMNSVETTDTIPIPKTLISIAKAIEPITIEDGAAQLLSPDGEMDDNAHRWLQRFFHHVER